MEKIFGFLLRPESESAIIYSVGEKSGTDSDLLTSHWRRKITKQNLKRGRARVALPLFVFSFEGSVMFNRQWQSRRMMRNGYSTRPLIFFCLPCQYRKRVLM
jgi:hypothetical protein